MPSYFYHLGFELYPYPSPPRESIENSEKDERDAEGKEGKVVEGEKAEAEAEAEKEKRQIWLPQLGTDIFDSRKWPKHSAFKEARDWSTECLAESSYGVREGVCEDSGERGDTGEEDNISAVEEIESSGEKKGRKVFTGLSTVARDQNIAITDWRYNAVSVEGVDMEPAEQRPGRPTRGESSAGKEIQSTGSSESAAENLGRVTQARFVPVDRKNTEVGWGIVHLYRDEEETPGLADLPPAGDGDGAFGMGGDREGIWGSVVEGKRGVADEKEKEREREEEEEDCTTLCVLAVPSFFTASDFLSWVGHKTREQVSHFRMVMTGRVNRFLVLMKFRDGVVARKWRAEWDGKLFVAHERETCHVMFIKSITFQTATSSRPNTSFPEISHDPFTPSNSASNILQPLSPTTTNLVELPTCPVCLERMDDDTSGLLTTPCQHVFHCDCLQKWRGTGCPVCRHTNASLVAAQFPNSAFTFDTTAAPFGSGEASLCNVCDCADDLWICLTCGKTGCGRYKGGHAKEHWKDTAHNFALEIETQHVWDYAEDVWVHRLLREKGDSKIIELPSRRGLGGDRNEDMVPREKLESIGMEYTHLLTSQLESQRIYFEDQVSRAVAKATAASQAAASASSRADAALKSLSELQLSHTHLLNETLPNLEKELAREKKKAEKSAEVARNMSKSLMEEKKVSEGLMERIGHVNAGMMGLSQELTRVKEENRELGEANRDLLFSITGGERLREMNAVEGGVVEGEVEGGTVSLPPAAEKGARRKGKGKK